ncbi:MAG: 23S rRNA (uracil(1939)-C(5))-methyltransferase RlmD [Erysipelotrichaceae bacterium]
MEINEIIKVFCNEDTYDGYGRCIIEDKVIYVKGLLATEEALVSIVSIKKKAYFAKIKELLKTSQYRIKPSCEVADECGGCKYLHLHYDYQLQKKHKRVVDCLSQIGGLKVEVSEIIPSPKVCQYRNKVQIPVQYQPFKMGFYRPKSRDIVEYTQCLVQSDFSNQLYHDIKDYLQKYHMAKDIRHVIIKHALINDQAMLILVSNKPQLKGLSSFVEEVVQKYPIIKSISLNINQRKDGLIIGEQEELVYGSKMIQEKLGAYIFNISSKSFYQINPYQTLHLYNKVVELAALSKDDIVVDLYCGTGTIGIFLAKYAKKVIGIDIVEDAIKDAKENAKLNDVNNIEFMAMDATLAIEKIKSNQHVDVIVVDPPRKGLSEMGIGHIIQCAPKRIVYVSCDPATLARDLKEMNSSYKIEKVIPVDMFPNTDAVETVCLLSKLNVDHHIEVELNMDELDLTSAESKATYAEIKEYVLENSGLKVTNLYIAQVKDKMGIKERVNYHVSKKEDAKVPQCPADKEKAILEALEHFNMID